MTAGIVESGRQYPYTDVPPMVLIGMYTGQLWQYPTFFVENIRPHLLSSFRQWRDHLQNQDMPHDVLETFVRSDEYACNGFVGSLAETYDAGMRRKAGTGPALSLDPSSLPYTRIGFDQMHTVLSGVEPELFYAETVMPQGVEITQKNISDGFAAFESLLVYKHWEQFF